MKIVVVGLGYVGLSNAVLLAQHNEVIGVDISQERVDAVNARKSPIIDAELSEYLSEKDLNLSASCNFKEQLTNADFVIISTPTSYDECTNFFDTSSVEAVILETIENEPNTCIIIKSTIPIGFIDHLRERFKADNIIFSPEFLREGKALYDNLYPSRIIVGDTCRSAKIFANLLLQGALKKDTTILLTGTREAEATKLFSNTYLALRVAFFNELDSYALTQNISSREIIDGVSLDPRIGDYYNNPSFGYGGYCLPKDTKQLLANYDNIPQNIIGAVIDANQTRQDFLAQNIIDQKPRSVGIYRLAMKNNSDNFRESSVLKIAEKISLNGIKIFVYEPHNNCSNFSEFQYINNLSEFKTTSDIILANRYNSELDDVLGKVYTRDLFNEN